VPGYNTIMECIELCTALEECEGVNMMSTHVDTQVCWLRREVNEASCIDDDRFVTWVKPSSKSAVAQTDWWFALSGKACNPGNGAEEVVEGQDVHPAPLSLAKCEKLCVDTPSCEGVGYFYNGVDQPNCHLRKAIDVNKCLADQAFEIRLRPEVVERMALTQQRWAQADRRVFRESRVSQMPTWMWLSAAAVALLAIASLSAHRLCGRVVQRELCMDRTDADDQSRLLDGTGVSSS